MNADGGMAFDRNLWPSALSADYFHGMGFARGTSYTQPADDIGLAALRSFQLPVLGRSSRKVPFAGHCTRFRRVLESDLFG